MQLLVMKQYVFETTNRLPVAVVFISHHHKVKKQPHIGVFVSFEAHMSTLMSLKVV